MSSLDEDLTSLAVAPNAAVIRPAAPRRGTSLDADMEALSASPAARGAQEYNPAQSGSTLRIGPLDTGVAMSPGVTNFLAGAGQAMTNVGRGVGQRLGMVSPQDITESRRLDAPLEATGAGAAGNIAGNVAMMAPTALIPGVNTAVGASLLGAGMGAVQPSVSGHEQAMNVAGGVVGGALGAGLGKAIGGIASKAGSALTQGQSAALRAGTDLGLQATPAQQTGSRAMGLLESALESRPETSGPFNSIRNANQTVLNKVAAKAIGVDSSELSSPVLANALEKISNVYEKVATKTPAAIDPDAALNNLARIEQNYSGQYAGHATISSNPLVQRFLNFAADGSATGEQLQSLSSNLGKAARNQMTSGGGDRAMGMALHDVKDVVDEALQNSLSGPLQREFAGARANYRNLMALTQRTNVVNPSSGNVNGRALASALMSRDRGGFTMGGDTSDLYNAARFVQAFPSAVGDSGTATRASGGLLGAAANLGGALTTRALYTNPVAQIGWRSATPAAAALARGLAATGIPRVLPAAGAAVSMPAAQWLK